MAYQIEYAYTCHIGKVRNNNEDNFWCCGESLDSENKGMSHVCSGHIKQADLPLLAVFDVHLVNEIPDGGRILLQKAVDSIIKKKRRNFQKIRNSS